MTTYSSTLPWRIPWTEEPGRLQSMGLQSARPSDFDRSALQASAKKNSSTKKNAYDILSLERSIDGAFAYRFELELADGEETSLKVLKLVKQNFRKAIRDDYAESFSGSSVASLFVEFPQFMLRDGRIVGKAVVMSMVVMSMKYDPLTRTGRMAVCLSGAAIQLLSWCLSYPKKNLIISEQGGLY